MNKENVVKRFFKQWPRVYGFLSLHVTPVLYVGKTDKKFISGIKPPRLMLNLGSGITRLAPDIVNLDLYPFKNVDVVANASRLPFVDGTFDAVCCEMVLEHVPDPDAVISELVRVTKAGGLMYLGVPFIFPWHPSPKDYVRWTREGICEELNGCEIAESGILLGPTSGLLVILAMWLATVFSFGINPLRKVLNYGFMLILSPFKLLDYIFARYPGAEDTAAGVFVVGRKKIL